MRYDDRLLTVLNQPADDRHDVAIRWRQLVDLVSRAGSSQDSPIVAQALSVIRADAPLVDEQLRAAAARSIAAWPLPFCLLQYFASEVPVVSAPALAAAKLNEQDWAQLYDEAGSETRAFITSLHPNAARGRGETPDVAQTTPAQRAAEPYTPPSLQDVVERIERRRQMRAQDLAATAALDGPARIESASAFRWECDASGEIAWVDGAPRGALIGRSLARPNEAEAQVLDRDLVRAFEMRAPFHDATMKIGGSGAVSGDWKISGVPAFDPGNGRFAGYRGVAQREASRQRAPELAPLPEALADPAALRELVHEIKTPLNAIIGFAEIIEGQYLGPADRGYRERASEIVEQARLLLTAIDDLDFAAKLHASSGERPPQADLGELLAREGDELRRRGALREVQVAIVGTRHPTDAAVQPELAERLMFRLFDLLIAHAKPKERVQVTLGRDDQGIQLSMSRPERLRGLPRLTEDPALSVDENFPVRLLRGLARLAGGDLAARENDFALIFPPA